MSGNSDQRRLQALLRFAAGAGSHGSNPVEASAATNSGDRVWLNEALRDYASNQFDPVQYMKHQLAKVFRFLKPSEKEDEAIEAEEVYEALEGIADNCDQHDVAGDLHKIGGYDVMILCMQHTDAGICWRACHVLATAVQNHEYCQNALIEMKALPILLSLVDSTSAADKVREKAFYALSCLVRGNDSALSCLEKNDGFSTLIRAMQSDIPRLRLKTVFFVKSLCHSDAEYARILHERGIEQQIVGMLRNHNLEDDSSESLNIIENLLGCLNVLIITCEASKKECCDSSFSLHPLLKGLKAKFGSREEYRECVRFSDEIMAFCFQDGDDADDR